MSESSSTPDSVTEMANQPAFRLLSNPRFAARLRKAGLDAPEAFENALGRAPRIPGGRSTHILLADPGGREPAIRVRPYRRGGLLGRLASGTFTGPARAFREFRIWQTLQARSAPLAEAVFASAQKKKGLWHLHLATVDEPRALDGLTWFSDLARKSRWPAALAACARSVRRFHDAGAVHGDLNLRNLLIEASPTDAAPPTCRLIDLAHTRLRSAVGAEERLRDLMRLLRSAEKHGLAQANSARVHARFLSAYCGSDRGLRSALLRALPREQRRLVRHRIGWRFGGRVLPAIVASLIMAGPFGCSDRPSPQRDLQTDPKASSWSLLATGDTGRNGHVAFLENLIEGQHSVAQAMTAEAQREGVDALVLLGDNFYWRGLDREHLVERLRRNLVSPYCYFLDLSGPRSPEIEAACPLAAEARNPIPIYAVLGNHDIETPESVSLQRTTVPDFLPGWRMSRGIAEVMEIEDGISLILLESEVAIRDPKATASALLEAVAAARGPWRIVATHRPIATDDEGGVPLGGYPTMVQRTLARAAQDGHPVQLVLSAHHHNLQAFELTDPVRLLQVGLGSGARAEGPLAAPDHPAARFGALSLGFARITRGGEGESEHLSVSIMRAPRWPWLRLFQAPAELARFSVDRQGGVVTPRQP